MSSTRTPVVCGLNKYRLNKICEMRLPLSLLVLCNLAILRPSFGGDPEPRSSLRQYLGRLASTLDDMAASGSSDSAKGSSDAGLLSPHRISIGEAHIVYKLHRAVHTLLRLRTDEELRALWRHGSQCTESSRAQQRALQQRVSANLCSETEWYKLAALAAPHLKTIVDVGSNKALLSALFLSLWGGDGAANISPRIVHDIAARMGLVVSGQAGSGGAAATKAGHCKHGGSEGSPLWCADGLRDPVSFACRQPRATELRLYSFDGSSGVARLTAAIISELHGAHRLRQPEAVDPAAVGAAVRWEHRHVALGAAEFVANFTRISLRRGFNASALDDRVNSGFEGGTLWLKPNPQNELQRFELVNVTTLDAFAAQLGGLHVDFLKIDAEGKDRDVLAGAERQLRDSLSLFSFECAPCAIKQIDINRLDAMGYSCFSLTRAGLFKWTGNCTSLSFMSTRKKSMGNILCASRVRAAALALSLDLLSFPSLLRAANATVRDPGDKSSTTVEDAEQVGDKEGQSARHAFLSRRHSKEVFVRWTPFCSPWPQCLRESL